MLNSLQNHRSLKSFGQVRFSSRVIQSYKNLDAQNFYSQNELRTLAQEKDFNVVSPETTFIGRNVNIEPGVTILPNTFVFGDVDIKSGCTLGPFVAIGTETGKANKIVLHQNVTVAPFSSLEGNVELFENVTVGPNARLRDDVVVGKNSRLGFAVEAKATKIGEQSFANHLSALLDADIGNNVNIGGLSGFSNFDPRTGEHAKTIIEDNAKIGGNVVLEAPITIPKGVIVGSYSFLPHQGSKAYGETPIETLAPGSIVLSRTQDVKVIARKPRKTLKLNVLA